MFSVGGFISRISDYCRNGIVQECKQVRFIVCKCVVSLASHWCVIHFMIFLEVVGVKSKICFEFHMYTQCLAPLIVDNSFPDLKSVQHKEISFVFESIIFAGHIWRINSHINAIIANKIRWKCKNNHDLLNLNVWPIAVSCSTCCCYCLCDLNHSHQHDNVVVRINWLSEQQDKGIKESTHL